MGQKICAIVTNEKNKYNKNLVHFFEENIVIIPLNLSGNTIEYFIKEADNFNTIKEYLQYLKTLPIYDIRTNSTDYEDNITSIVDIIETYELKNFSIRYYTEWADIPDDDFYIAVINGEIKKDSIVLEDDKYIGNYNNREKYNNIIGLNFSWITNENRYFNYNSAREEYTKNMI
ncbi:hypothetical protein LPB248_15710 [Flavobacterium sp. LPB0248]|uniref:hypothetical protein n=1 Tax=Flavobacterium sp. LPB0248 TaxID=2614441 RepID=UPI0015A4F34D|nr:hypothetical protein [Flavobacterium sp. LPB0248]QLC67699.1 hypothetical protein LPB248_15710 [Flavobacterium sp. LPB0248]